MGVLLRADARNFSVNRTAISDEFQCHGRLQPRVRPKRTGKSKSL
jgi:hypothetical protein